MQRYPVLFLVLEKVYIRITDQIAYPKYWHCLRLYLVFTYYNNLRLMPKTDLNKTTTVLIDQTVQIKGVLHKN